MIVSAGRFHVRSAAHIPRFYLAFYKTLRHVIRAPGFRGGRLLRDDLLTYWILTGWEDLESMLAFRDAPIQQKHRPYLPVWCDQASFVHWKTRWDELLPSWSEAHRRMVRQGRVILADSLPNGRGALCGIPVPNPTGPVSEKQIRPKPRGLSLVP